MQEIIAILITIILGLIALAGVGVNYFVEVQQIDRFEIEYWKKKAEAAKQFEVEVSRKIKNGIRKVRISLVA